MVDGVVVLTVQIDVCGMKRGSMWLRVGGMIGGMIGGSAMGMIDLDWRLVYLRGGPNDFKLPNNVFESPEPAVDGLLLAVMVVRFFGFFFALANNSSSKSKRWEEVCLVGPCGWVVEVVVVVFWTFWP